MKIKTGKEIVSWTRGKSISELNIKPYNKKWVPVSDIIKRIEHIKDVIRNCSWEDKLGEQTLHYSDLHNLFKILESELNKPEVTQCNLSQNNKKEATAFLPHLKKWVSCLKFYEY